MDARELREQGIALANQGDTAQAKLLLEQSLALEPQNADAWAWLAIVAEDRQSRLDALRRALQIDPGHADARKIAEHFSISFYELMPPGPPALETIALPAQPTIALKPGDLPPPQSAPTLPPQQAVQPVPPPPLIPPASQQPPFIPPAGQQLFSCPRCGQQLPPGLTACTRCGLLLGSPSAPAQKSTAFRMVVGCLVAIGLVALACAACFVIGVITGDAGDRNTDFGAEIACEEAALSRLNLTDADIDGLPKLTARQIDATSYEVLGSAVTEDGRLLSWSCSATWVAEGQWNTTVTIDE